MKEERFRRQIDGQSVQYTGISFVLHGTLLALVFLSPLAMDGDLSLDSIAAEDSYAKLMLILERPESTGSPEWMRELSQSEPGPMAGGADFKGEERRNHGRQKTGKTAKRGRPAQSLENRQQRQQRIRKSVVASSLLASFMTEDGGVLASDFNVAGNAIGAAWGQHLIGRSRPGEVGFYGNGFVAGGGSILGLPGGSGCCGNGPGRSLGVGSWPTGKNGHRWQQAGASRGHLSRGRDSIKIPVAIEGRPDIIGQLDKAIVQRIVRQHRNEIRYCYEQELMRRPGLYGKVTIRFEVSVTGRVARASIAQTTMRNSAVEQCLVGKVQRWLFPQPKGGAMVRVTYPFVFKSSQ